jgi:hypothetical protein
LRGFNGKNGKFRTDDFTVVAVNTVLGLDHNRRMISFLVEFSGQFQSLPGAKFDTIPTSFASVFQDENDALSNLYRARIKRNPPEFHRPLLQFL